MRSPHTSYRWREERVIEQSSVCSHPHQLQVERRESHRAIKCMLSPHQQVERERESSRQFKCCAHHTRYSGEGDERVIEPSSVCAHQTPATGVRGKESMSQSSDALTTQPVQVEVREREGRVRES